MLESIFVKVRDIDGGDETYLPIDLDNTLSLELLVSQFPRATGLKCISKKKDSIRTVRKSENKFFLSYSERWSELTFFCTCPSGKKKAILEEDQTEGQTKLKETIRSIHTKFPITFDLLAIGLSFDTSEEDLYKYLSRFGELLYCKLKVDEISLQSKGTAYFRFKEAQNQNKCLSATHLVDKTKIIIKIPKEKFIIKDDHTFKLYLFNISPNITREELRTYFSQFGLVVNLFKPFDNRNFAFITFCDQQSIDRVLTCGHHHTFNGGRVSVNVVVPKEDLVNGIKPTLALAQNNKAALKRLRDDVSGVTPDKQLKLNSSDEIQNHDVSYPKIQSKEQEPSQNPSLHIINSHYNITNDRKANNHIPQEYNALYPPPNYIPSVNQLLTMPFYGDRPTTFIQNQYLPSTSTTVPFCDIYPNNQIMQMPPVQNNHLSAQHPQTVSILQKNTAEESSQLQCLVNMFIQEIRNNVDKLSKS